MNDAQNEMLKEDPELKKNEVDEEVVMDEVAEARPVHKSSSGFTVFLIVLVLLCGAAGAGWYYQAMWWPQVKQGFKQAEQKIQQAQVWLDDLMSSEEARDPMAAPKPRGILTRETSKPDYAVSAISESKSASDAAGESKDDIDGNESVEDKKAAVVSQASSDKIINLLDEDNKTAVIEQANEDAIATATLDKAETVEEESKVVAAELVDEVPVAIVPESTVEMPVIEAQGRVVAEASSLDPVESNSKIIVEVPVKAKPETQTAAADLNKARQAFWQRNLPKAEALYKEQIKHSVADANSWGELGNVYYLQAKWKQAAQAYTEAALVLLDKGDFPQAMFLRYIVIGLDPVQAGRIDERMLALQAPARG